MGLRGIRGAIGVPRDEPDSILEATQELLAEIQRRNPTLQPGAMASVFFTLTPDLTSAYPAQAARDMGWRGVPLLCTQEMAIRGGLPRIIRVLIHWNTHLPQEEIKHVYLGEATRLRPDLAAG